MNVKQDISVTFCLPEYLVREVDRLAEQKGSSRSELMCNALRHYINRGQKLQMAIAITKKWGKAAGINTQKDLDQALAHVRSRRESE